METERRRRAELDALSSEGLHCHLTSITGTASANEYVGRPESEVKRDMIDRIIAAEKKIGRISD